MRQSLKVNYCTVIFSWCSSDSEKSERKAKKEEKKRKVMPGPVHFGSNEPVILAELDPQVY
jgi:hypothetical protein